MPRWHLLLTLSAHTKFGNHLLQNVMDIDSLITQTQVGGGVHDELPKGTKSCKSTFYSELVTSMMNRGDGRRIVPVLALLVAFGAAGAAGSAAVFPSEWSVEAAADNGRAFSRQQRQQPQQQRVPLMFSSFQEKPRNQVPYSAIWEYPVQ